MQPIRTFTLCLLLALVAGCQMLGLQKPDDFSEKLAYGFSVHTAVQESAAVSLDAGDLTAEDGEHVLKIADEARLLLDGARAASEAGDIATAEGRLALATNVLTQLQAYLRSRTPETP